MISGQQHMNQNASGDNEIKQVLFRLSVAEVEKLDLACKRLGLDRNGYLKLVINTARVTVSVGGAEAEFAEPVDVGRADIVKNLQNTVNKIKEDTFIRVNASIPSIPDVVPSVPYKSGDVFIKNEASDSYDRLRRATVAFCFQNDVADESLLSKAQRLFIEGNVAKLLGEVVEEEKAPEKVPEVAKSAEEFKQVWFEKNDKELGGFVGSRFKLKKEKKKK
jgi:hypothetical protein